MHDALVAASHRTDLEPVRYFSVPTDGGRVRLANPGRWLVPQAVYWKGVRAFEPGTLAWIRRLANDTRAMIDVGANVGLYALLAARQNPGSRVFAIEAAPATHKELDRNLALNGLPNIESVWCALGDACGTARLFLSDNDCSASILSGFREAQETVDVPLLTLDAFVEERQIESVGLIKIDVEGAEDRVLRGALEVLRRHRPYVVCEILAGRNEDAVELLLRQADYQHAMITADGLRRQESLRGDDTYTNLNFLFWPSEAAPDRLPGPVQRS